MFFCILIFLSTFLLLKYNKNNVENCNDFIIKNQSFCSEKKLQFNNNFTLNKKLYFYNNKSILKKFNFKKNILKNLGERKLNFFLKNRNNFDKKTQKFRQRFAEKNSLKFGLNFNLQSKKLIYFNKNTLKNLGVKVVLSKYNKNIYLKNLFIKKDKTLNYYKNHFNFRFYDFFNQKLLKNLGVKQVYSNVFGKNYKNFTKIIKNNKSTINKFFAKNNKFKHTLSSFFDKNNNYNICNLCSKKIVKKSSGFYHNFRYDKPLKDVDLYLKFDTKKYFKNDNYSDVYFNENLCSNNVYKNNKISKFYYDNTNLITKLSSVNANYSGDITYKFEFNGKNFYYYSSDFIDKINLTDIQLKMRIDPKFFSENLPKLLNFNLSKREIVEYILPEIVFIRDELCKKTNINLEKSYVELIKNTCEINFKDGKMGKFLDLIDFYDNLYRQIISGFKTIKINLKTINDSEKINIRDLFNEKGCFSTNFSQSLDERKNNIRLALSKFDGLVLNEGEILSFNTVTGVRNEQNGYKKAKIISGGTFIEGFGGGVCQVSTTLYNACLLAGLEILEVHNHSLPVSYIEPSFDAMVNSGSSDLVIRNNSGGKIMFTTSSLDDKCKVKIYGLKNKYKIVRYSEKTAEIPALSDEIVTDFEKYNIENLEVGEERRISYPKPGYCSSGYLRYIGENGDVIKNIKIRENRYNPTRGIIVTRNN